MSRRVPSITLKDPYQLLKQLDEALSGGVSLSMLPGSQTHLRIKAILRAHLAETPRVEYRRVSFRD